MTKRYPCHVPVVIPWRPAPSRVSPEKPHGPRRAVIAYDANFPLTRHGLRELRLRYGLKRIHQVVGELRARQKEAARSAKRAALKSPL